MTRLIIFIGTLILTANLFAEPGSQNSGKGRGDKKDCNKGLALYFEENQIWDKTADEILQFKAIIEIDGRNHEGAKAIPLKALFEFKSDAGEITVLGCGNKGQKFHKEHVMSNPVFLMLNKRGNWRLLTLKSDGKEKTYLKNARRIVLHKPESAD